MPWRAWATLPSRSIRSCARSGRCLPRAKVHGDEIPQLTEAGIPALRILANQYGTTTAAMQDMITQRLVPSSEAIPGPDADARN